MILAAMPKLFVFELKVALKFCSIMVLRHGHWAVLVCRQQNFEGASKIVEGVKLRKDLTCRKSSANDHWLIQRPFAGNGTMVMCLIRDMHRTHTISSRHEMNTLARNRIRRNKLVSSEVCLLAQR